MEITGFWKVSEVNVFDRDFKQTWRTTEDILADDSVNPMQKSMAQVAYMFKDDGTVVSLMSKELVPAGEGEAFNDDYVIAHQTKWKSEDGKLWIAAEENGEDDWQELVPNGDGYEVFGYQRITRG